MNRSALEKAIEAAGSIERFANLAGVTKRQVHNWKNGDGIPAGYVPKLSQHLSMTMHELRPDIFPERAA